MSDFWTPMESIGLLRSENRPTMGLAIEMKRGREITAILAAVQ